MRGVKKVQYVIVGDFVSIDFGSTIGCQWAKVEQVDIDLTESDAVVLSVRLGKRFGSRYLEETFQLDADIGFNTEAEMMAFLKMYKLDEF